MKFLIVYFVSSIVVNQDLWLLCLMEQIYKSIIPSSCELIAKYLGQLIPYYILCRIPTEGVVVQEFDITRAEDGTFTGVVGLV